jgi:transmembrane sensor
MTPQSNTQIDVLVSEQAAHWFIRLVANDLSSRERREYLAWLKASERHVEALLDIYRYHGYGRKAKLNVRPVPIEELGSNVIPFMPCGVSMINHRRGQSRLRRRMLKLAAAVASIIVSVATGWTVKTAYFDQRIATSAGEWTRSVLEDGSVLRIGPNTRLRWSFDAGQRLIVLSRGEAMFEVARDSHRPFVVTTPLGDVRALGTQFGVMLKNESTAVVTVAQGRVAVTGARDGQSATGSALVAELVADQQILMASEGPETVKEVDASRELQWASGYYEFRGETVGQAIEEFNRRNRLQVVMADERIGAITMPFTTVKLDDPESFAAMLAARPDVQVAYESANVIRLLPE